jgi:xylulokinase
MSAAAYMGIDIGTTSVKCMAVNENGRHLLTKSKSYKSESPYPGWVEQNPEAWMEAVCQLVYSCNQELTDYTVKAVSFSGHMSSPVFLDEYNHPLRKCITVADTRSYRQSEALNREYSKDFIAVSGNYPFDCFIAAKLLWLKEAEPDIYEKMKVFVCAKDYVRYRLTGELCTEQSDAGNSNFFDLNKKEWSYDLIRKAGLRPDIFPKVIKSTDLAGFLTKDAAMRTGLKEGTPVVCGAADMACSQLGSGAVMDGCLAITLGTSGQVCIKIPDISPRGIGKITYHLGVKEDLMYAMATIFSGGLAANWCYQLLNNRQQMEKKDFDLLGELAKSTEDIPAGSNGILFLPFLTGSASPYFNSLDRASFTGLSLASTKEELLHAVLEGVAYNIYENIEVFKTMNCHIDKIHLGGGGANLPVWGQIIADVIGKDIDLLESFDASTLGACTLARSCGNDGFDFNNAGREIKLVNKIRYREKEHAVYLKLIQSYTEFYHEMTKIQKRLSEIV